MKDVSTQPIAETITPLGTPKKDGGGDRDNFSRRYRFKVLALVCSFILLIIGGGDHGFRGEQSKQAWSAATKFFRVYLGLCK